MTDLKNFMAAKIRKKLRSPAVKVGRICRTRGRCHKTREARPVEGPGSGLWGGGDLLSRGPPQYHRRGGA